MHLQVIQFFDIVELSLKYQHGYFSLGDIGTVKTIEAIGPKNSSLRLNLLFGVLIFNEKLKTIDQLIDFAHKVI
jgi:hypothetical protein